MQTNWSVSKQNTDKKEKKMQADALYKRSRDNPSVCVYLCERDKGTRDFTLLFFLLHRARSFLFSLLQIHAHSIFFFGQVK
jgi:hypothetical protein